MQSTNQLFHLFRLRSAKFGIPSKLTETRPPLFQRPVPLWARWTWALIACDIFMTGSAIELTWSHWSSPVQSLKASPTKTIGQEALTTPDEYVLRPSWQRGGLCIAHLGFGAGIAVALLVTQVRFVRTFAILPARLDSRQGSQVFLQCAHNFKSNGLVFPINKCVLQQGRNETEMIFRVAGEKGHWYINLDKAIINGRHTPPVQARKAILGSWGGKLEGHWTPKTVVDSRWKSGPIRRAVR